MQTPPLSSEREGYYEKGFALSGRSALNCVGSFGLSMNYRFSNLLGAPFRGGNIELHKGHIYSAVGNRVAKINLAQNLSETLPFESPRQIHSIAVSPNGTFLLTIDESGKSMLINNRRRVVLHHFSFKGKVAAARFSPCGAFFAVAVGRLVQVWRAPGLHKEFAAFQLHRTYGGLHDTVTCLDWSLDSQWVAAGSKDLSVKVFSVSQIEGYTPCTLAGHKDTVVAVAFTAQGSIYTVSRDGALFQWRSQTAVGETGGDGDCGLGKSGGGTWRLHAKHFFNRRGAKLTCAVYHSKSELLVAGFSSGVFDIVKLPDFDAVQTLSVSREAISSVAFDESGEWVGLGCAALGQLLVWEWRSETYVLKQQGHYFDVNCAGYSPDGGIVATGADDAKLKLWNPISGFCYVTFSEHTMPVSAVAFLPAGHAVLSASLDGTVRAFDLVRYRNFRTFTAPQPAQFASLAVDAAGEVVAAGALDTFAVYVWSVKTGRVLDVLAGHEGPVCALAFSPTLPILASASWDKTVRLWDVFAGKGCTESLPHTHDVLALAFRPDGKQMCSATLDGQLYFWDPVDGVLEGTIEGRRDVAGGRLVSDRRSYENSSSGKCFTTLCYSADGAFLLAGGSSKYICMYDVTERIMLRRFQISHNRSLDGVLDELSSRGMTDAGPAALLDDEEDDTPDVYGRLGAAEGAAGLPGTGKKKRAAARCKCVRIAPTGRSWLAATTEGLLMYSLDEGLAFDPADLDEDVTPEAVHAALRRGAHLRALLLAVRLGDPALLRAVVAGVPGAEVATVARGVPAAALGKLLACLADGVSVSPHVEFLLQWVRALCLAHGNFLRERGHEMMPALRSLQHAVGKLHGDLAATCESNAHMLDYIAAASRVQQASTGTS